MTKKEIRTIKDTIEVVRREVPKCRDYAPLCFQCEIHNAIAILEYFLSLDDDELPTIEA